MYCPECGAEYRPGFDRCADCGVELVHERPPEEEHEAVEYVAIHETSRPAEIMVVKSLLQGAGIPFNTEGEGLMDLFPSEMLGGVYKPAAEVKFLVPSQQAEEARALLDAHPEDFEGLVEDSDYDADQGGDVN